MTTEQQAALADLRFPQEIYFIYALVGLFVFLILMALLGVVYAQILKYYFKRGGFPPFIKFKK